MSRRRFRLAVAFAFLGALTLWPPIHMVAARVSGFAPSRLGGWGMYAAPDENFTGVEIFVLTRGADLPAGVLDPASPHRPDGLRFPFEVHLTLVTPEGLHPLDGSSLDTAQLDALWLRVRGVRAFAGRRSAARLAATVEALPLSRHDTEAVLVVLATPGVDLGAHRTRVELRAFLVRDGDVAAVRAVATGATDLERFEQRVRGLAGTSR